MTKVGALWARTSKNGVEFISGILDNDSLPSMGKIPVIVFKNKNKQSEKSPDYIMYLSEKQGQKQIQADIFQSSDPDLIDDAPF